MRRLTLVLSLLTLVLVLPGCRTIVLDLGSETVFGRTTSGALDQRDDYVVGLLLCTAELMPPRVQGVAGTAGNFFDVVSGQFPAAAGWTYQTRVRKLGRRTIRIRTYDVQGTAGRVGAEFHVRYRPRSGDPSTSIHWIQVYDNNHALSGPAVGHGNRGNRVDVPGTATTPYYDDGYAATSGACSPTCTLYDFPGRTDATRRHNWEAVTFLAQGPAVGAGAGRITFLRPGFRWGWQNRCRSILDYFGWILFSESRLVLDASETIRPGVTARLSLASAAELQLERRQARTSVRLPELQFGVSIEERQDEAMLGEAATSRFTVTQGSGELGEYSMDEASSGGVTIAVTGGQGYVQWETGEVSFELQLDMGDDLPDLVATGYGQLGEEGDTLVLDAGFQAVEPDLARRAAAKMEGGAEL